MTEDKSVADLLEAVQNGTTSDLRAEALGELSSQLRDSDNPEIAGVIAGIVKDESLSTDFRTFAYIMLLEVSSRPVRDYPSMERFLFPKDVDWILVNQFVPSCATSKYVVFDRIERFRKRLFNN